MGMAQQFGEWSKSGAPKSKGRTALSNLWMVARIFSYKIVHVGDFILSLLRLYLVFFCTFI